MKIKVQKETQDASSITDVVATFCYLYPRYTYGEALDLPLKLIRKLLNAARREKASYYLEMLQITRAAQAEKSASYESLASRYKKEARNG